MPQFLFAVEIPPIPDNSYGANEAPAWLNFAHDAVPRIGSVQGATRLQRNVWLIPAANNLPLLMQIASAAKKHGLSYSCLLAPDGALTPLAMDIDPRSNP